MSNHVRANKSSFDSAAPEVATLVPNDKSIAEAMVNPEGIPTPRRGRYSRLGPDRHSPISNLTSVLLLSSSRPGRLQSRRQIDPTATQSFGDALIYKAPGSLRIFLQNVKGLTYSTGVEDYKYYIVSQMAAFSVDCFGLVETNTAWQHYYLQMQYRECVQRQFRVGKTVFGFRTRRFKQVGV
jgi:hypothetical protein